MTAANSPTVLIVGAGVAGMSAACALSDAGWRVQLLERRGYLGGRAASYLLPGVDEIVDNCQHALFGCCTNLLSFYERIGVADRIHWTSAMTMIAPDGKRSQLGPTALPAPLHGMPKLLKASAFSLSDKMALARAFSALMRPIPADSTETLAAWLYRHKQTSGALNRFWRLVIASALNAEIDTIALPYAAKVIRELFMNSAEAGAMGMSSVPLSELYEPVPEYLAVRGGSVHLNTHVDEATFENGKWHLQTRNGEFTADALLIALPFEGLRKLMPHLPQTEAAQQLHAMTDRHVHWPICSVHFWFDREVCDLEHAVLLDREVHWMYNQSRLQKRNDHYVELVVSATRTFAALERKAAINLAYEELAEFFPQVRQAKLLKSALLKDVRATFGVFPGVDAVRPTQKGPWPQSFLAGDWTQTGWPSTMESAARSGHLAAEAITAQAGRFLAPDLAPRGLMRFL